jgi:hypothetical protein
MVPRVALASNTAAGHAGVTRGRRLRCRDAGSVVELPTLPDTPA